MKYYITIDGSPTVFSPADIDNWLLSSPSDWKNDPRPKYFTLSTARYLVNNDVVVDEALNEIGKYEIWPYK